MRLIRILPALGFGAAFFYWVVTSSWFIRYAILPRVSAVTGVAIRAGEVDFSLFSGQLTVRDFVIGSRDWVVWTAGEYFDCRVRYWPFWRGVIAIEELSTHHTRVEVRVKVGGPEPTTRMKRAAFAVPRLQLSRLSAEDSALQIIWQHADGRTFDLELTEISARMDHLINGQTSNLRFGARPRYQDAYLQLTAERGQADWLLRFTHHLRLDWLDWLTQFEEASGVVAGFEWPSSTITNRIGYANGVWDFRVLRGVGTADAAMNFDVTGTLAASGFTLRPGSRVEFNAAGFQRWFGNAPGAVAGFVEANGQGSFQDPAGHLKFQLFRQGETGATQSVFALPPLQVTGEISGAWRQAAAECRIDQLRLTGEVPEQTPRVQVQIPAGAPVGFLWRERRLTAGNGRIHLDLYQIPGQWLNAALPLPEGWGLESGLVSGNLVVRTPETAQDGGADADGEVRIANFRWRSPAGVSDHSDLNTTFALRMQNDAITLPEWHTSLARGGVSLMDLSGSGSWNAQSEQLEFELAVPRLRTDFLPLAHRDRIQKIFQRLQINQLALQAAGNFRPRRLQINRLELHTEHARFAMQPTVFDPGNRSQNTDWQITLNEWPLAILSSELAGNLNVEGAVNLSDQALAWDIAAEVAALRYQARELDANRLRSQGSYAFAAQTLDLKDTSVESRLAGAWRAEAFQLALQPQPRLTTPLRLTGATRPECLPWPLTGGNLLTSWEVTQWPERFDLRTEWRSDAALLWDDWPCRPVLTGAGSWFPATGEAAWQGALTGTTGADAPMQIDLQLQGNLLERQWSSQCRIGRLTVPVPVPATLVDSTLECRGRQGNQFEVTGDWQLQLANALHGPLRFSGRATPEAITLEHCSGRLSEAEHTALEWQLTGEWPGAASRPGRFQLTLPTLHAPLLFNRSWRSPEAPDTAEEVAAEAAARPLNFGSRSWSGVIALEEYILSEELAGSATANLAWDGERLQLDAEHWELNASPLEVHGTLTATTTAPTFALQLSGQTLNLQPFWHWLGRPDSDNTGWIDAFSAELNGEAATGARFWDTLTGSAKFAFSEIDLENTVQQTALGKILFLPLEGYLRVRALLPNSRHLLPRFAVGDGQLQSLYYNTGRFKFDRGEVTLRSADGRIELEQFLFSGHEVEELRFEGSLGMGSDRRLDLDSTIDFQGVIVPLKLEGTVDEPAVRWDQTTLRIFSDNAVSLSGNLYSGATFLLGTSVKLLSGHWQQIFNSDAP